MFRYIKNLQFNYNDVHHVPHESMNLVHRDVDRLKVALYYDHHETALKLKI